MVEYQEYKQALKIIELYHLQQSQYTQHFIDWRNKYFNLDVRIQEWKNKKNTTRYTTDELHKRYSKCMLQSPFM
jgi:hypothetical protein